MKSLLVYLLIAIGYNTLLLAESLERTSAFKITSLSVNTKQNPQIGDTLNLVLQFDAKKTCTAVIHLHFPGQIAPFNNGGGQTARDSIITVDSGSSYTYTFPLKFFNYGGSLLETSVYPQTYVSGIENVATDYIEVQHSSTSFGTADCSSTTVTTGTATYENLSPLDGTLSINGKVLFEHFSFQKRGVYGVTVILLFHKRDQTGGQLGGFMNFFHPWGGCLTNVHKCKVGPDGSFSFNFTGPGSWSDYVDVTLLVTRSNDAADLRSGEELQIQNSSCGTWETFPSAYTKVLPITNNMLVSHNNVEIMLNKTDGGILRYLQMSQDFATDRPIGVIPPQIWVEQVKSLGQGIVGEFQGYGSYPEISIVTGHGDPATVAHEYGHYSYLTLTPGTFNSTDDDFHEGFAEFFQFPVRNYISKLYDDYMEFWDDNQEEASYAPDRFRGIRYQFSRPLAAAFSCFLWNVYDSYADDGFKAVHFENADNDDVPEPHLIFQKLNGLTVHPTFTTFLSSLKNAVDAVEAESIDKIYANMMISSSTKVRPAQIKNLEASVVETSSHPDVVYTVALNWDHQAYFVSGPQYYDAENLPTGIHIYHKDLETEDWELIATLDGDETSYGCVLNSTEYKVSTFNSSGDSYGALTIIPEVLFKKSQMQGRHTDVSSTVITGMSVSPNPFTNSVDLNFELVSGSVLSYELLSVLGESLQVDNVSYSSTGKKRLTINTSHLPTGTYLLKVLNTDSSGRPTYQTHKIAKAQ